MPLSNKEIENRAVKAVIEFERENNRQARDVRSERQSYDVKSDERFIEIKGIEKSFGDSGNWRFIQQKSVQLLLKEKMLYVYIVDNLANGSENAGIYVLTREEALPYLKIAPQVSYTLQIPARDRENYRKK